MDRESVLLIMAGQIYAKKPVRSIGRDIRAEEAYVEAAEVLSRMEAYRDGLFAQWEAQRRVPPRP